MSENATIENLRKLARLIGEGMPLNETAVSESLFIFAGIWESEVTSLTEKVERLEKHGRNPTELAGRLYWFATEGGHIYEMDDGGQVVIERPAGE